MNHRPQVELVLGDSEMKDDTKNLGLNGKEVRVSSNLRLIKTVRTDG